MEERLRFVARLLDGEAMTEVCREFGISRKTGYKIFDRYKEHGLEALTRPLAAARALRQPAAQPGREPDRRLKREKPHWGARKIRELLLRRLPGDVRLPAKSTIHAVLDRHGLVKRSGKRRARATGTPLSQGLAPNDLWCADFKGEFKLGNGRYCYPLTVTDHASRFLLMCEALDIDPRGPRLHRLRAAVRRARPASSHPLRQWRALRQSPTASSISQSSPSGGSASASPSSASSRAIPSRTAATSACTSLSRRRQPGPPGMNSLQQQARFDDFVHEFNTERPHEASP